MPVNTKVEVRNVFFTSINDVLLIVSILCIIDVSFAYFLCITIHITVYSALRPTIE